MLEPFPPPEAIHDRAVEELAQGFAHHFKLAWSMGIDQTAWRAIARSCLRWVDQYRSPGVGELTDALRASLTLLQRIDSESRVEYDLEPAIRAGRDALRKVGMDPEGRNVESAEPAHDR